MNESNAFSHLSCAELTDIGQRRTSNEDSVLCLPESGVFCVADGMGGAAHGEMASLAVVEALAEAFSGRHSGDETELRTSEQLVKEAVINANAWILEFAKEKGATGCGSTMVALVFDSADSERALILHAGDSRAYRLRNGQLEQLTADHSLAASLGLPDGQQVAPLFRSVLTNAIGTKPQVRLERTEIDVKSGDLFLLCSDGITNMIPDDEVRAILSAHPAGPVESLAHVLVDTANARGGTDNASVVLVKVSEKVPAAVTTGPSGTPVAGNGRKAPTTAEPVTVYRFPAGKLTAAALLMVSVIAIVSTMNRTNHTTGTAPVMDPVSNTTVIAATFRSQLPNQIDDTLITGRWGLLKEHIEEWSRKIDGYPEETDRVEVYRRWASVWERIHSGDLDPAELVSNCTAAAIEASNRAGFNPPSVVPISSPGTRDAAADEACRVIHLLQNHVINGADSFLVTARATLSPMGPDPERALSSLWLFCHAADDPALAACGNNIATATNAMHSLETWLDTCRDLPIPDAALKTVPALHLTRARKSIDLATPEISRLVLKIPAAARERMGKNGTERNAELTAILGLHAEMTEAGPGSLPLPWSPERRRTLTELFQKLQAFLALE